MGKMEESTKEQSEAENEKADADCERCECLPLAAKAKLKCQLAVLLFATFTITYCGTSAVMFEIISTNQNLRSRIWVYGVSLSSAYLLAGLLLAAFIWLAIRWSCFRRSLWVTTLATVAVHYCATSLCLVLSMRQVVYARYKPLVSIVVLALVLSSNALLAMSVGIKLIDVHKRYTLFAWGSRTAQVLARVVIVLFLTFVYCSGPLCAFVFSVTAMFTRPAFTGEVLIGHLGLYTVLHVLLFPLFYVFDIYVDSNAIGAILQSAYEYLCVNPSQVSAHDRILSADMPNTLAYRVTRVCCPWRTSVTLRVASIITMTLVAQILDDALLSAGWTYAVPYVGYMIGAPITPVNVIINNYVLPNWTVVNITNTELVNTYSCYLALSVLLGALAGTAAACALAGRFRTFGALAKIIASVTFFSAMASFTLLASPCNLTGEISLPSSCITISSSSSSSSSASSSSILDYGGMGGYALGDLRAGLGEPVAQMGLVGPGLMFGGSSGNSQSSSGTTGSSSTSESSSVCGVVATYCGAAILVMTTLCRQVLLGHAYCQILPARTKWAVLLTLKLFASLIGGLIGPLPFGFVFNAMCVPTMQFNATLNMTVSEPCESLCEKNGLGLNVVSFIITLLIYLTIFALLTTASCIFDSNFFHDSSQESVLHDGTSASSSNSLSLAPSNFGTWSKLIHLHDHNLIIEMSNLRAHIEAEQSWSNERVTRSNSLQDAKSQQSSSNTPVGNLDSTDLLELKRRNLYTVWKGRARSFSLDSKNSTIMRFRVELDATGMLQKTIVVVEAQVHDSKNVRAPNEILNNSRAAQHDIESLNPSEIDGVINEAFSLDSDDTMPDDADDNNNDDHCGDEKPGKGDDKDQ